MNPANPLNICTNGVCCACPVSEFTNRQARNFAIRRQALADASLTCPRPNRFCALFAVSQSPAGGATSWFDSNAIFGAGNFFATAPYTDKEHYWTRGAYVENLTPYSRVPDHFGIGHAGAVYAANAVGDAMNMIISGFAVANNTGIHWIDYSIMWVSCN